MWNQVIHEDMGGWTTPVSTGAGRENGLGETVNGGIVRLFWPIKDKRAGETKSDRECGGYMTHSAVGIQGTTGKGRLERGGGFICDRDNGGGQVT